MQCEECDPCKKGPQCEQGEGTLPACDGEDCSWGWDNNGNKWVVLGQTADNCGDLCDCGAGPAVPDPLPDPSATPPVPIPANRDLPCEPVSTTEHDSLEVVSDVTVSVDDDCFMTISVSKVKYVLMKNDCGISAIVSDGTTDTEKTHVDICDCDKCDEPAPGNCPERECSYVWFAEDDDGEPVYAWRVTDSSQCTTHIDGGCCCPSANDLELRNLIPGGDGEEGTPGGNLPADQKLKDLAFWVGGWEWSFQCHDIGDTDEGICPTIDSSPIPDDGSGDDSGPGVPATHLECRSIGSDLCRCTKVGGAGDDDAACTDKDENDFCEGCSDDGGDDGGDDDKYYECVQISPGNCKCVERSGSGTSTGNCNADNIGENCDCPTQPVGACCFGSSCVITTKAVCIAANGDYKGDGSGCAPGTCAPPPGTPTGACCDIAGNCTNNVTDADCNGAWHEGESCTANTCCGNCRWSWNQDNWQWEPQDGCNAGCECAATCSDCGNGFPGIADKLQPCVSTSSL